MNTNINDMPLPYGWVKQTHESGQPFYVDTKASPPRSIWVHPYEDEQYLKEHPEDQQRARPGKGKQRPSMDDMNRRHSFAGAPPSYESAMGESSSGSKEKRGFLGKMKDKAVGTKEEREAEKKRHAEEKEAERKHNAQLQAQAVERAKKRRQELLANRASYQQYEPNTRYGGPQYGQEYYYGQPGLMGSNTGLLGGRRRGYGGGGMAMPLMGGMAGGLLLGEMMGGGLGGFGGGYGGGFGGGGFGGGGFDGGFGGGGFDGGGGGFGGGGGDFGGGGGGF